MPPIIICACAVDGDKPSQAVESKQTQQAIPRIVLMVFYPRRTWRNVSNQVNPLMKKSDATAWHTTSIDASLNAGIDGQNWSLLF
jgi:hypothetical protein